MFSLITSADPSAWRDQLARVPRPDPHQSWGYHRACEISEGGLAVLVVAEVGYDVATLPLLLQEVRGASGMSHATSAYGYPGLAATTPTERLARELQRSVRALGEEFGVVSVSVQLNPFQDSRALVAGPMELHGVGPTAFVDLTRPEATIWRAARPNHRQPFRKTDREYRPRLLVDARAEHLDDFVRLYESTMLRKGAPDVYRFPATYYSTLADQCRAFSLFHAQVEGEIVSSAIFLDSGSVVHYHLAGTQEGWGASGVSRWLLEKVRRHYTLEGRSILHLGRGLGGKRDSLFAFKSGFGAGSVEVERARLVLRPQAYAELCAELPEAQPGTFPGFRVGSFPRQPPESAVQPTPHPHGILGRSTPRA